MTAKSEFTKVLRFDGRLIDKLIDSMANMNYTVLSARLAQAAAAFAEARRAARAVYSRTGELW